MQHDEFIGLVQHRARLDSRGAAEAATRATLETLGQRLAGGKPPTWAPSCHRRYASTSNARTAPPSPSACRTSTNGWLSARDRVSTHRRPPSTPEQLSVVDEAITGAGLQDVRDQLGAEYADLFDFAEVRAG